MKPLWRWLAHAPTILFRARVGCLLGERFLLLHHTGRRSGRAYSTMLEVVARHLPTNTYYVAAGFGENTDWYQNIIACADVEIEVGLKRLSARADRLTAGESQAILTAYAREHRLAFRSLGRLFGFRGMSPGELATRFPIVRLRTTQPSRHDAKAFTAELEGGRVPLAAAGFAVEEHDASERPLGGYAHFDCLALPSGVVAVVCRGVANADGRS